MTTIVAPVLLILHVFIVNAIFPPSSGQMKGFFCLGGSNCDISCIENHPQVQENRVVGGYFEESTNNDIRLYCMFGYIPGCTSNSNCGNQNDAPWDVCMSCCYCTQGVSTCDTQPCEISGTDNLMCGVRDYNLPMYEDCTCGTSSNLCEAACPSGLQGFFCDQVSDCVVSSPCLNGGKGFLFMLLSIIYFTN